MEQKAKDFNVVLKQLKLMGKLSMVFIIICFMVFFQNASYGIGMFIVFLAYFVLFFRGKVRMYQKELKTTILEENMRPLLGTVTYKPKDQAALEAVTAAGLLPMADPKGTVVRDTVRGAYRGRPVLLTDVTTNYATTVVNPKGKPVKTLDHLSGCYWEMELEQPLPRDFALWPKETLPEDARTSHFSDWIEHPISTSGEGTTAFAESHLLYVPKDQPPPVFWNRFARAFDQLIQHTPGRVAVQARGNMLWFFIENRFVYTLKIPIRMQITERILRTNPLPEVEYIAKVTDTLMKMR